MNTTGGDGDGIDCWRGSLPEARVTGVIATVSIGQRDAEVKLLIGCAPEEMRQALATHQGPHTGGVLVVRDGEGRQAVGPSCSAARFAAVRNGWAGGVLWVRRGYLRDALAILRGTKRAAAPSSLRSHQSMRDHDVGERAAPIATSQEERDADTESGGKPMVLSVADPGTAVESQPPERFDDLFRALYPRLVPVAERLLGERAEAEDIVQEAFVRLARAPHPLLDRPDVEVGAWLRRVVLNLGVNRLRDRRRADERLARAGRLDPALDPSRTMSEDGSPSQAVLRAEAREEVRLALAALPERQRACLLLRHAGHSYAEIAETLGIALGSVGVYLARGERAFRAVYDRDSRQIPAP